MKSSLVPGLTATRRITVDEKRTIGFMGEDGRVYATPEMVRDMEQTCRDLLLQHADEGEDSVGMRVEIDHLAPTPLGFAVSIEAKVVEIQGRVVTFEVNARDDFDQIGRGRHMRFVADTAKSKARIAAKRAKASNAQSA